MNRLGLRRDDGQALVEFVLLFPLLLVMVLFLVEFGFVLSSAITVNNAASEAARYAAVGSAPNGGGACDADADDPSIEGMAVRASADMLDCSDVTVGYIKREPGSDYVRGDGITVRVTRHHTMVTPLGELMTALSFGAIDTDITLSSCAEARLERGPVDQTSLPVGSGC